MENKNFASKMNGFAPWELNLIALYKATKADHARIEGTGYMYAVEDGILRLIAGNTTHFVNLDII